MTRLRLEVVHPMSLRPAEVAMGLVVLVAGAAALALSFDVVTNPPSCPIPVPPIVIRTVGRSDEWVFLTQHSSYRYSDTSPQAPVADLRYELAGYNATDNHLGPGTIIREGRLDGLNRTGDFQYHDMAAEGEFSPGNDFFILRNPPPVSIQLRILGPDGSAIAWNMIVGCA